MCLGSAMHADTFVVSFPEHFCLLVGSKCEAMGHWGRSRRRRCLGCPDGLYFGVIYKTCRGSSRVFLGGRKEGGAAGLFSRVLSLACSFESTYGDLSEGACDVSCGGCIFSHSLHANALCLYVMSGWWLNRPRILRLQRRQERLRFPRP